MAWVEVQGGENRRILTVRCTWMDSADSVFPTTLHASVSTRDRDGRQQTILMLPDVVTTNFFGAKECFFFETKAKALPYPLIKKKMSG
jgi:hypothetical protein